MQKLISWQAIRVGAFCLGMVSLWGCPRAQFSEHALSSNPEAIPIVQSKSTDTAIVDFPEQTVAYEVCGELTDWQRLDESEQLTALRNNPRYGEMLNEEPLKGLFEKFWNESVIAFTTYGLSARTEPIFLSGVWTGIDAMETCYEGDRPNAINQGELAEVWLIGHRIIDISWTGEEYHLTVTSTAEGLQFVQFERFEKDAVLPLVVLENDGSELSFASGDW